MKDRGTMRWRRALLLLALALAVGVSALAFADSISEKNMGRSYRTKTLVIENFVRTSTFTWKSRSGTPVITTTIGTGGLVAIIPMKGYRHALVTTTIANPVYPVKLQFKFVAVNSNPADSGTCASADISGVDTLGRTVAENVASLTTTAKATKYAYESVARIQLNGCSADLASYMLVGMTEQVGLPLIIRGASDLVSICQEYKRNYVAATFPIGEADISDPVYPRCLTNHTATALPARVIDRVANSVNLTATGGGKGLVGSFVQHKSNGLDIRWGDFVVIRYRANANP